MIQNHNYLFPVLTEAAGGESPSDRDYSGNSAQEASPGDLVKAESEAAAIAHPHHHGQQQQQHLHHLDVDNTSPTALAVSNAIAGPTEAAAYMRYPQTAAISPSEYASAYSSAYGHPPSYYGAAGGSTGANGMYMASFLYPHLYSASIHGNGGLQGIEGGVGVDDYGLHVAGDHQTAAAMAGVGPAAESATVTAYVPLEGEDESQTGPIRGAYGARQDHSGHVWRPY